MSNKRFTFSAFTLAEVLITLGIIGVVAALTIPSLIQKYQESVYINSFKETYSILSQAYIMAVQENGTVDTWDNTANYNYFRAHLKITDDKGTSNLGYAPFASTLAVSDLNGTYVTCFRYHYILANGSSVWFQPATTNMRVDTNGQSLPNKFGYDLFYLQLGDKNGTPIITYYGYPSGWPADSSTYCKMSNTTASAGWTNGATCAYWLLKHGNMDYLHRDISNAEWLN